MSIEDPLDARGAKLWKLSARCWKRSDSYRRVHLKLLEQSGWQSAAAARTYDQRQFWARRAQAFFAVYDTHMKQLLAEQEAARDNAPA